MTLLIIAKIVNRVIILTSINRIYKIFLTCYVLGIMIINMDKTVIKFLQRTAVTQTVLIGWLTMYPLDANFL